jgi:hypothetical protein
MVSLGAANEFTGRAFHSPQHKAIKRLASLVDRHGTRRRRVYRRPRGKARAKPVKKLGHSLWWALAKAGNLP